MLLVGHKYNCLNIGSLLRGTVVGNPADVIEVKGYHPVTTFNPSSNDTCYVPSLN